MKTLQCKRCGKITLVSEDLIDYLRDLIYTRGLDEYATALDLLDDIVGCCDAPDTTWKLNVQFLGLQEAKEKLRQHGLIGGE